MSTSLWFGGQSCDGVADTSLMTGGGFDTLVVQLDELSVGFGSGVLAELSVAEFVMAMPSGVAQSTLTTSENVAVSPGAMANFWHENVPAPSDGGVVHDQSAGAVLDTYVVPAGRVSLI